MIPRPVHAALVEYRAALEVAFPGRVEHVRLFGSFARGEATEESDVDVLVLISNGTSSERIRAMGMSASFSLAHDVVIEPVVLSTAQWRELESRERLFAREVNREGIEIAA